MASEYASLAGPVARLIEQFHKLPGIGPKMAQRLCYYLLRMPAEEVEALAGAITTVKQQTFFCSRCQNITDREPCTLCSSPGRDIGRICVVQDPMDVFALERTGAYKGLYHVLHGVIDPMNRVGPDNLRIRELLARLTDGVVKEIVLATNPTVEGEATALYVQRLVQPLGPRVTRLARGLPVGSDLGYADNLTLARALEGRQEI